MKGWMVRGLVGGLVALGSLGAAAGQVRPALRDCRVVVRAYAESGRLTGVQVLVNGREAAEDAAGRVAVECGAASELTVRARGFDSARRVYRAEQAEGLVAVGLRVGSVSGWDERVVAAGQVLGLPRGSVCDMVRLVPPVPGRGEGLARVSEAGRFVMEEMEYGEYVAVVFGDRGVCGVGRVRVNSKNHGALVVRLEGAGRE